MSGPDLEGPAGWENPPRHHVLFLYPGPVPPPTEPGHSPLWFLSRTMSGDVLTSSWRTRAQHRQEQEATRAALGRFGYFATLSHRVPPPFRTLWDLGWFVAVGTWRSWRHRKYDAIIGHGPFKTGLAAWVIGRLTRTPVIVELPGHPFRAFQFSDGRLAPLKAVVARRFASFVTRRADHLHLLYPSQVDDLPQQSVAKPSSIFPDFVRASRIPAPIPGAAPYVLFLGYPWYLKGVDVLIKAWLLVTEEFPGVRLRVVGHCPDRAPFERLAAGCTTIDFEPATNRALEYIANAELLVLASRTEAAPRVVLEAMLAAKATIATDVDGIPTYVQDGETGLLFPSGDHQALADRLRRLLGDEALRARMGAKAAEIAWRRYTEAAWVENVTAMVARTLAGGGGGAATR